MRRQSQLLILAVILLLSSQVWAAPVPIAGIVSSGVGLNQGAQDVNFLLISAPAGVPYTTVDASGMPTSPAVNPSVVCTNIGCTSGGGTAFPFTPGGWTPDNASSSWLGINPVQYGDFGAKSGPGTGVTWGDPTGWYVFRVYFVLPDNYAASTAHITGTWSADNLGGIFVNNNDLADHSPSSEYYAADVFVPGTGGRYPYGNRTDTCIDGDMFCFLAMHAFDIATGFHAGINYIDFRVYNPSQQIGNPVGFRVSWSGTYEPVPEPVTTGLGLVGLVALAYLRRRRRTS